MTQPVDPLPVGVDAGGFGGGFFFTFHVFVLDGVEDLATGLALDELGIFGAGDDANYGVFAGDRHGRGSG